MEVWSYKQQGPLDSHTLDQKEGFAYGLEQKRCHPTWNMPHLS